MIPEWQSRTLLLLGEEKLFHLQKAHVLVVGLGGVGAYAVEMLCRAGVYNLSLVDGDIVESSNRNRQLPALVSQEGMYKTVAIRNRCLDINPEANIRIYTEFIKDNRIGEILDMKKYDYVIDAIDTLSPKVHLIFETLQRHIPLVSAMGAGGKQDPSCIEVADISKTRECPLAASVRKRLRQKNVYSGFKAVFSTERSNPNACVDGSSYECKQSTIGTISFLPAMFGCWCASVCINDLLS